MAAPQHIMIQDTPYEIRPDGDALRLRKVGRDGPGYTVRRTGESWRCDCPDAVFRRRHCKHIVALEKLGLLESMMTNTFSRRNTVDTTNLPALSDNGTAKPPVALGQRGIIISSLDELWRFATAVAKSGLAPKGMERPETVLVAIQLGLELGLSPMSSLQNIGVINGRPGVYGDAAKALVEDSGLLEEFDEWLETAPGKHVDELPQPIPDTAAAVCYSKRRGRKPKTTRFSVAAAKRAGLWGKSGPWTQYPDRMLTFRARGFNLRDNFADVLKGLRTYEEIRDYPAEGGGRQLPGAAPAQREHQPMEVIVPTPSESVPAHEEPAPAAPTMSPLTAADEEFILSSADLRQSIVTDAQKFLDLPVTEKLRLEWASYQEEMIESNQEHLALHDEQDVRNLSHRIDARLGIKKSNRT